MMTTYSINFSGIIELATTNCLWTVMHS